MNVCFLEPLDILYLRGNAHFGGAGAHGMALMPPWPSLAAGALRSRLLAEGERLASLDEFRLIHFGLAQLASPELAMPLLPLPADVMVVSETLADASYARPAALPDGVVGSQTLPLLPAFTMARPAKPQGGLWMNAAGIRAWLDAAPLLPGHLCRASDFWLSDPRLGIALDPVKRSAADGKIYTAEAIAFKEKVGFIAVYGGAPALPAKSLLRLGGDGRAAAVSTPAFSLPQPDWQRIAAEGRFRMLLTTPGFFADGWQPTGVPGELVAASVGRAATVSGWDLLNNAPKPAQRAAPAGSVYWFDKLADLSRLKELADNGLPLSDAARQAEGWNRCLIAPWAKP